MNKSLIRDISFVVIFILVIFAISICSDSRNPSYYELSETEMIDLTHKRQEAYEYAMKCSGTVTPAVPFDKLGWALVPQSVIIIEASDGRVSLGGFYNPTDSTIYLPFKDREEFWLLVHESLHAIGFVGHPRVPFEVPCRATADQNH